MPQHRVEQLQNLLVGRPCSLSMSTTRKALGNAVTYISSQHPQDLVFKANKYFIRKTSRFRYPSTSSRKQQGGERSREVEDLDAEKLIDLSPQGGLENGANVPITQSEP